MDSFWHTRRASTAWSAVQQALSGESPSQLESHSFMVRPTAFAPARTRNRAATELSTPPDIAIASRFPLIEWMQDRWLATAPGGVLRSGRTGWTQRLGLPGVGPSSPLLAQGLHQLFEIVRGSGQHRPQPMQVQGISGGVRI